jgi:DNA-binding CsgD family transcriptional regulator
MPYGYIVKPFTEKDLKSNISMALARATSEQVKLKGQDFSVFEKKYDFKLSERERDIMTFFLEGATYKDTAASLGISINTVKTYQKRIFQKFKVESKAQLINMIKG